MGNWKIGGVESMEDWKNGSSKERESLLSQIGNLADGDSV